MRYGREWYRCPICGQKLLQKNKDGESKDIFIKCKKCKNEIEIKIEPHEPRSK